MPDLRTRLRIHRHDRRPANVTVGPDPQNPYSKGYFCAKGRWAGTVETDPARINAPLLRRDGRLAPVPWKGAIDTIATKLGEISAAYGPRSIAIYSGNSAAYSGHLSLAVRNLMAGLGTDTLFTALTVDCIARYRVAAEAMNLMYAVPVPFYDAVPGMLLMGSNATVRSVEPGREHPRRRQGGRAISVRVAGGSASLTPSATRSPIWPTIISPYAREPTRCF